MKVICGDRDRNPFLYNGEEGELSLHKQRFYADIRGRQVLDLGCGTGGAARFLQQSGNTVCGITSSEPEAVIARRIMPEVLVEDLDALVQLPFGPARFDVVLLGDILEHLK
ncbi:MAG TPA: class I SAM-dependent methyltransferase, partial [Candidatus Acidoferrum sp.]|nr:class I SAM-dependent methyltransferase [Candidatus Acidoferrum sp.]